MYVYLRTVSVERIKLLLNPMSRRPPRDGGLLPRKRQRTCREKEQLSSSPDELCITWDSR